MNKSSEIKTFYKERMSLIKMIKRVRNNFFHGGKYRDLVVEDSLRNSTLLYHSLLVLNECLYLDNEVAGHFFNLGN